MPTKHPFFIRLALVLVCVVCFICGVSLFVGAAVREVLHTQAERIRT